MARYTYIIVGAGAAGCVLANRLSADPANKVLLLEAGGRDSSPLLKIPAGLSKLMGTKVNWSYDSAPQKQLNNRQIFLPQGKVLGGSTSVNAMLYIRGHRLDYDEWAELGCKGWSYEEVLPYFKVHERNERLADEYHGNDGELSVVDQVSHNPLTKAYFRAAQQAGLPRNDDPNGAVQEGVFFHQVTQRDARRESASTAFLHPVMDRPNLTVLTDAEANRIVVENGRATGLEYTHKGKRVLDQADAELIISAGVFNTPRLLLLSGIGPKAELEEVGIKAVHDLPGVGKNLRDHLEVYVTRECKDPVSYTGEDRWNRAVLHAIEYGLYRTGPAAATVCEASGFAKSSEGVRSPDLQLQFVPAHAIWKDGARNPERARNHGVTIQALNVRPRSTGEVKLVSSDPNVPISIDPNYLADEADMDVSVEAFRLIRRILDAPAFKAILKDEEFPGPSVQTDEEVRAFIRKWGKTDFHPVGTCKMGVDEMAVVDPELRVRGLEGLRVIDSSIMPTLISGNTQAPTMMIGEKGAALILGTSL